MIRIRASTCQISLAAKIKALRSKQDELSKARVIAEAEMTAQGYRHIDINIIHSYVEDLKAILYESEVSQRKAFLRSFVEKIIIDKGKAKLYYKLPIPPDKKRYDGVGVLPIDTPSGAGVTIGRTFNLVFDLTL